MTLTDGNINMIRDIVSRKRITKLKMKDANDSIAQDISELAVQMNVDKKVVKDIIALVTKEEDEKGAIILAQDVVRTALAASEAA